MPKGLPPDVSLLVQRYGIRLKQSLHEAIVYFEIPSYSELRSCWTKAFLDSIVALRSIQTFLILSLRPLYILIVWISHHVWKRLQVVFKHSAYHAIQASKRGAKQAVHSGRRLIEFQKSLSREVVAIELGILVILIMLYAIRRYIQKKRYVERFVKWYTVKQKYIQKRYTELVDKIAETSILVAILLPHVVYIIGFGLIRYFLPSSLGYVATQTIFTSVISFGIPLLQTIVLIARWRHHEHHVVTNTDVSKMTLSLSHKVRELDKVDKTTTQTLFKDILNRLMYWIVYNVLVSSFHIIRLLPILAGFFPNGPDELSTDIPSNTSRWLLRGYGAKSFSTFQLSHRTCDEIKLFFFLWLQLLSSMSDADSSMEDKSTSSPKGLKRMKRSKKTWSSLDQSSIGLVYDQMKPFLQSVTNNVNKISTIIPSHSPDDDSSDDQTKYSIIQRIIQFVGSFLDFLVWTKILSKKNKNEIIKVLAESIGLFPALPSLFMPSYFTKFGIIYVSSVIPAAKSTHALEIFKKRAEFANISIRYLEYWVLYAMLSTVFFYLTPIISWFPFNTHIQLIVWLSLQMELISRNLYRCFTEELIFFGVMKSPVEGRQGRSIIMRLIAHISKHMIASKEEQNKKEAIHS